MDLNTIKNNPNGIYELYYEDIQKTCKMVSDWVGYSKEELIQESYFYFLSGCKKYDPHYKGQNIPFKKFIFKHLITSLRSFVQYKRLRQKLDKEFSSDFLDYQDYTTEEDMTEELHYKELNKEILIFLTPIERQILDLSLQGYKQREITKMVDIKHQCLVSRIKVEALEKIKCYLNNKELLIFKI